jgi:hypothetical protein
VRCECLSCAVPPSSRASSSASFFMQPPGDAKLRWVESGSAGDANSENPTTNENRSSTMATAVYQALAQQHFTGPSSACSRTNGRLRWTPLCASMKEMRRPRLAAPVSIIGRKPRSKSRPEGPWRRVWTETRRDLLLTSDDLATKQSTVARRVGLRPPTLARRWIDSTGGPGKFKWPYRYTKKLDRGIAHIYFQLQPGAPVNPRALQKMQAHIKIRRSLLRPVVIRV